jgi:hypothetical protein
LPFEIAETEVEEMRKICCILLFLLLSFSGWAQAKVYVLTATLAWDAVTKKASGAALLPTDAISYQLARLPMPITDRTNPAVIAETTGVSSVVAVPADSKSYSFAVRAKLVTDGGATMLYSVWVWSDQAGTPAPFVLQQPSTDSPVPPDKLRIQ